MMVIIIAKECENRENRENFFETKTSKTLFVTVNGYRQFKSLKV